MEHKTIAKLDTWATDRNFFGDGGADFESQMIKLNEEMIELFQSYRKGKVKEVVLEAGDNMVVVVILARLLEKMYERPNEFVNPILAAFQLDRVHDVASTKEVFWRYQDIVTTFAKWEDITPEMLVNYLYAVEGCLNMLTDTTLPEAFGKAVNKIKNRKGKFVDGSFIKEEDLN